MNQTLPIDDAFHYSRYAARLSRIDAPLVERVLAQPNKRPPLAAWRAVLAEATADTIDATLRSMRRELMLRTLIRDIVFRANFPELVGDLSAFADMAVSAAVRAHSYTLFDCPQPPFAFSVIAMGKMGGLELNVSSDIDVVFLCDQPARDAVDDLARLAKRVSRSLDREVGGDFVFRVDTRLRPYGDAGPAVPTLDFLERYFVEQGRMWERLAWLRSRVCCGPLTNDLMQLVSPFVYRRYLDFDAVASMRDLHAQLRAEKNNPNNIKLGRGGIRELEFGVQLRQLMRGGRDPRMRERTTGNALCALANAGHLSQHDATSLTTHYELLRRVEHMLQYRDDLQTQLLPSSTDELAALSKALGFVTTSAFETSLKQCRNDVATFFDGTLSGANAKSVGTNAPSTAQSAPAVLGFADNERVKQFVDATLTGAKTRALPVASRDRLLQLVHTTLVYAATTSAPDDAAMRAVELLSALASRSSYLALMIERPSVLQRVVDLAATSSWAVRYVATHPLLLDELIDSRSLSQAIDYNAWRNELQRAIASAGDDTERGMDAVRHFQQGETFRLLSQDIAGKLSVEALSDHLSALADVVVEATLNHLLGLAKLPDEAKLAVIAYGRWGGKELGYASDLDLIFLMPDAAIEHRDQLTRVAQRLQSWLTTLTAAGRAYEIDVRLRPDGQAGLLLSSVSSFASYQNEKAWTWEHQAITRARYVTGDATVGAQFEAIRDGVIAKSRDWATLRSEVLQMRRRIASERPNRNAATHFDIKHDTGGLVDMEFAVQALVLRYGAAHPSVRADHGNIALALRAGELGLLGSDGINVGTRAANAYRELRSQQHRIRLRATEDDARAQLPIAEAIDLRQAVQEFSNCVFEQTALPVC
jgi:[glutamine synthetase] adenylyltransferase / [glutamine synthetase]-adenylyl-L-tyrosine phosphorylase